MKFWMACVVMLVLGASAWGKEDPTKPHVGSVSLPLSPQEAQKRFEVPSGFEVRLFAAEPDVINPVAMSFDEKGRLWVVELYEYPYEKPKDEKRKGRDRVICLEDPDGAGHATKRTVVVEDLWLATAITYGNGGIYVGQAPDMYFYPIEETADGPKAGKRKTLLTGFGLDDKHELLNSFCWGPDGWLYMTEGVFTHSKVRHPDKPDEKPIPFDAGVGRYNPYTEKFEVWADGISNQWGIDWDAAGNAFVSACVIDHIWHVVPGGVYVRQGGVPNVPYTYGLLGPINKDKHRHHMAAYSGINIYQGNQFPKEYLGTAFMGNIHGNCIDHDKLTPDGSSFTATDMRAKTDSGEFLEANDDWFRPVSTQTGPDGALWIMDWYDKYPCYQNSHAPDLDRERGRIWRVVYVGKEKGKVIPTHEKGMDLGKASESELMALLSHSNIWQRRVAQRLIVEGFNDHRLKDTPNALAPLALSGKTLEGRMAAIWTIGSITAGPFCGVLLNDPEPAIRAWSARFLGDHLEERLDVDSRIAPLLHLAGDKEPQVLAGVAEALRRLAKYETMHVIAELAEQSPVERDPDLSFLIWMATEPKVLEKAPAVKTPKGPKMFIEERPAHLWATEFLEKLSRGKESRTVAVELSRRIIHRVIDARRDDAVSDVVWNINRIAERNPAVSLGVMLGFLDTQQKKGGTLPAGTEALDLAKLQASPDKALSAAASQLAALWGNAAAAEAGLKALSDPKAGDEDRRKSLQLARQLSSDAARKGVLTLLAGESPDGMKLEAIRALGEIGTDESAEAILQSWKSLSPDTRRAAAEVLTSRLTWTKALLKAVEAKTVSTDDISALAIRTLSRQKDEGVQVMFTKTIGRYRPSDADKLKLIDAKKKVMLDGTKVDYEAGHQLMQKTCLVCHSFYNEGMHVGPDLTGVGRSSIDALLHNVIDPNEIIGAGYENTIVETKDKRSLAGRLVENTDDHVKLLSAGDKDDVVPRSNIESMRTEKISVMPEGLVDTLPDEDLRNLLWYIFSPPQEHGKKGS
jgi:putative membrane-bound dehydrogenase-like protein